MPNLKGLLVHAAPHPLGVVQACVLSAVATVIPPPFPFRVQVLAAVGGTIQTITNVVGCHRRRRRYEPARGYRPRRCWGSTASR